ncbi:KptA family-domain-containing protein [Trametes punicea]|nr:KptA family-domain-containing protein [Trametes punicea]
MSQNEPNARRADTKGKGRGGARGGPAKLRGLPKDSHEVRISKTLSWILRHGSQSEGLAMRPDGYVRVNDLLQRPKMRELTFDALQEIVKSDAKNRYSLVLEADPNTGEETWWIRANQGHSLKASDNEDTLRSKAYLLYQSVVLDYEPIKSASDIPTGIAVHGTNKRAWESIKEQGLSKMTRNHIHLAQGVAGSGVISGMRSSSQILIYVDVQKAIDAGIKFYISANGVVLTDGDERGFLHPSFFSRVETADGKPLPGWDGPRSSLKDTDLPATSSIGTGATLHNGSAPRTVSVAVGPSKKEEGVQVSILTDNGVEDLRKKISSTTLQA